MRRALPALVLLLAAGCSSAPTPAEPRPDLVVWATVDRSRVRPGDVVTYTIELDWAPGVNPAIPDFARDIEGLRIAEQRVTGPDEIDGRPTQRFVYELTAPTPGSYEIPGVEVAYTTPSGQRGTAGTEALLIEALAPGEEVGDGEQPPIALDEELRDIAGPEPIPDPNAALWLSVGAALFLAALAGWFVVTRRRWAAPPPPPRPPAPDVQAMEELDRLRRSDLLPRGENQRFAYRLSHILRVYLGRRFDFPAAEWTTTEILQGLPRDLRTVAREQELRRVLDATDMVKYAGRRVGAADLLSLADVCQDLVQRTRPASRDDDEDDTFVLDEAEEDTLDGPSADADADGGPTTGGER